MPVHRQGGGRDSFEINPISTIMVLTLCRRGKFRAPASYSPRVMIYGGSCLFEEALLAAAVDATHSATKQSVSVYADLAVQHR